MSVLWTKAEDDRLRKAILLNPNVGAPALKDRFPHRSRESIRKRLLAMRSGKVEPSETTPGATASLSARSLAPLPPRGYSKDEIAWAKATIADKTARLSLRWEAVLILGHHNNPPKRMVV